MQPPFTAQQFLDVFREYNDAVWPMQVFFYALALVVIGIVVRSRTATAGRVASAVLSLLWLWMGIVYHLTFFRTINPLATAFGVLFIIQAVLFAWFGVWTSRLSFRPQAGWNGVMGWVLLTYALVVYPLLGYAFGQRYPSVPTFGLPCPTTIFSIGLLLWTDRSMPRVLPVIPIAWSVLGLSAAISLGIREDFGLIAAGVFAAMLLFRPAPLRSR